MPETPAPPSLKGFTESSAPPEDGAADIIIVFSSAGSKRTGDSTINGDHFMEQVFTNPLKAKTAFKRVAQLCIGQRPTLKEVRTMFLAELTKWLENMGLTVRFFVSVDRDELFMRVSLDRQEVEEFYAEEFYLELQVTREARKALDIRYDPEPTDEPPTIPPSLPFSKDLQEEKSAMVAVRSGKDNEGIFRKYKLRNPNGGLLKMVDRIRVIRRIFAEVVDFDDLKGEDVIEDYFPVHLKDPVWELRAEWANFRPCKLLNFWPTQPLDRIANYFGMKVAFEFAWIGATIRMLAVLAALAALSEVVFMLDLVHDSWVLLGWGVIMVLWGAAYTKTWARTEKKLAITWNSEGKQASVMKRSDFRGEMMPSPLNANENKKQYAAWKTKLASVFSHVVTMCFCGLTCTSIYFIWGMREHAKEKLGKSGGTAISTTITVVILLGNFIFSYVAKGLVYLENPETLESYANSMIIKKFSFQFINAYNAFFYIAFIQRHDNGQKCPDDDCIALLSKSLFTTYLSLAGSTVASMVMPFLKLWWSLRQEDQKARKIMRDRGEDDNLDMRAYMEIQAKMAEYSLDDQIDDMLSLVIAVGYVLLFGGVCPGVIALALIVFMVQLRAGAWKLCRVTKRPFPLIVAGLGAWGGVVNTMTWLGTLATVLIPLTNLHMFDSFSNEQKLFAFFGAEHFVVFFRLSIQWSIADMPSSAALLQRRRQYIMTRLLAGKAEKKRSWDITKLFKPSVEADSLRMLQESDDWHLVDEIPLMTLFGPSNEDGIPDEESLDVGVDDNV